MTDVVRDLVFTLRTWRKAPGFAVVTVLTLAVLLLGWRAVALAVTRRSRAQSAH